MALLFSLILVPVVFLTGAAIDYSRASAISAYLQVAADAAAMSAVTQSSLKLTVAQAKQSAEKFVDERVAQLTIPVPIEKTVQVTEASGRRSAVVTVRAQVPTSFTKIVGYTAMRVGGDAKASGQLPPWIDFYLFLDNSPSMGLGATQTDIDRLTEATVSGSHGRCAFACHDLSRPGKDNYAIARQIGVTLRIDDVRQAAEQVLDLAISMEKRADQFRSAVYTFGDSCEPRGFTNVATLTDDLASVRTRVGKVDMQTMPYPGYNNDRCTDLGYAMTQLNSAIAASGDGLSSTAPQKIVFLVSDGVAGYANGVTCTRPLASGDRCLEPMSLSTCTALKDRGVKVAVLYTTYLALPSDKVFRTYIEGFRNSLPGVMESCASPGLFAEVSPDGEIPKAMAALFEKSLAQARLAN